MRLAVVVDTSLLCSFPLFFFSLGSDVQSIYFSNGFFFEGALGPRDDAA